MYIDNNKVEGKDERSFPQSTRLDQSKSILLHCIRRNTNKSIYKISQETNTKLSQMLSILFELQTENQVE